MAFEKESLVVGRNQGRERKVGSVPLLDLSANRGKGINKYLGNRTGAGGEGTRGEGCWECCNRTKKKEMEKIKTTPSASENEVERA